MGISPGALATMGTANGRPQYRTRALDPETLQPAGTAHLLTSGIPLSSSSPYEPEGRKWTGRINLIGRSRQYDGLRRRKRLSIGRV